MFICSVDDHNDPKYVEWHQAHETYLHTCITQLEGVIAVHKRKKKWLTTKQKTVSCAFSVVFVLSIGLCDRWTSCVFLLFYLDLKCEKHNMLIQFI